MHKTVLRVIVILQLLIAGQLPTISAQQVGEPDDTVAPLPFTGENRFALFERDDILELTLTFDITRFMKRKADEENMDALLTWHFNENDSVNKLIKLRSRGNYRLRNCSFPPVRLDLDDADFGFADLDSLDNVKLVTHCEDNPVYYNYLMREYLVYRLFNIISDYSFRVRFLKIHYVDTGKRGYTSERYAFIIEPLESVMYRTNSVEIEDVTVGFANVERQVMDRIALFQYMIGNSDWYLPMIHNFKIVKPLGVATPDVVPVPYDFDYSGFVNTHYAVPREDLNLESITDRVYLGPCRSEGEFREAMAEFLQYREAFLEEIRNFDYLDRSIRRELTSYIESFFELYRKDLLLKRLQQECQKR